MTDMLPVYESKATEEQKAETHALMVKQVKGIVQQESIEVPMQHVKIRCGCLKLVHWMYMYRCLYCGIWFCKECAEQHFGIRVPESWAGIDMMRGELKGPEGE